jgi:hypothetical protein
MDSLLMNVNIQIQTLKKDHVRTKTFYKEPKSPQKK